MSQIIRDLLLCAAVVLILAGCWLVDPAVAFLSGGGMLFGLVWLLWPREDKESEQ
jgi:hypothetical protein